MEDRPHCGSCYWYDTIAEVGDDFDNSPAEGLCLLNPPVFVGDTAGDRSLQDWDYPLVYADSRCQFHRLRV